MKTIFRTKYLLPVFLFNCTPLCCRSASGADGAEIKNVSNARDLQGTNETLSTVEDAEAAEIRRLRGVAYRNGRLVNAEAVDELTSLFHRREERCLDEVTHAQDPLAVISKMAEDPALIGLPQPVMDELLNYWEDPRAEQILSVLSHKGPRRGGELPTPAGIAYSELIEVRAKKKLKQIVTGKVSVQQRIPAIVAFLDAHPDLVKPHQSAEEDAVLARVLFNELAESDDPTAVRLLLKSGKITPASAKKHVREMLEYANDLTGEEAASNPALLERLYESGDSSVIPLFEKWAPSAKTRGEKSYFESTLHELHKRSNNSSRP